MDTSSHANMSTLFDQLGLASAPEYISAFIQSHQLSSQQRIENADFWSTSQAAFIKEAISDDTEWAEVVDHLDAGLHHH